MISVLYKIMVSDCLVTKGFLNTKKYFFRNLQEIKCFNCVYQEELCGWPQTDKQCFQRKFQFFPVFFYSSFRWGEEVSITREAIVIARKKTSSNKRSVKTTFYHNQKQEKLTIELLFCNTIAFTKTKQLRIFYR